MDRGWISLHRKLLDSLTFQNPELLKVWIWCLLRATHRDYVQMVGLQEVELKPGQFVFGRKKAAVELDLSEDKTYRLVKKLEKLGNISIKSTTKYSIISIENWAFYQYSNTENQQQINSKSTANQHQINTNNNNIISCYNISLENYPQGYPDYYNWCSQKNIKDMPTNTGLEGRAYYLKYLYERANFYNKYKGKDDIDTMAYVKAFEERKAIEDKEVLEMAQKL